MAKERRILEDVVLGQDPDGWDEHLVTEVFYQLGGTSMFTGHGESRGYYVSVRLEDHKDGCVRFTIFTGGVKRLVQPAKMFSAKALAVVTPDPEIVRGMQAKMRAQYEVEIAKRAERAMRG